MWKWNLNKSSDNTSNTKEERKLKSFNFVLVSMGSGTSLEVEPNEIPPNVITVDNDDLKTSVSPYKIYTSKVSFCLVIALYDPDLQMGSLSHIMSSGKHLTAENVIEKQLADMQKNDSKYCALWAKLVGEVTENRYSHEKSRVVKEKLRQISIPIVAEDLGGGYMREVVFDLETGKILVWYPYQLGWRKFFGLNKKYL